MQEIKNYFKKKAAYVGTDGRFISSVDVSTVALVLHNMTCDAATEGMDSDQIATEGIDHNFIECLANMLE